LLADSDIASWNFILGFFFFFFLQGMKVDPTDNRLSLCPFNASEIRFKFRIPAPFPNSSSIFSKKIDFIKKTDESQN